MTLSPVWGAKKSNQRFDSLSSFVIKPEHGSGGCGVKVIDKKKNQMFDSSGRELSFSELKLYLADMLYGLYSL